MALEKAFASGRRFGSRYGRRLRHKFSKIEAEQKKLHKCPYCTNVRVKRVSAGIWECRKCGSKFTGRAYTIPKKAVIKEEAGKAGEAAAAEMQGEEQKGEKKEEEKPQKYREKPKKKAKAEQEIKEEKPGEEEKAG